MKTNSLLKGRITLPVLKGGRSPLPKENLSRVTVIEMAPVVLKLKEILVPVDFSKTARQAIPYAVLLAKQFDARITFLHVAELPRLTPGIEYIGIDASETRRLTQRLKSLAKRAVSPDVNVDFVVKAGYGHEMIVDIAHERSVDLIVITTHGFTGLKHVLMGSTAERVVRHATCPVLVVR